MARLTLARKIAAITLTVWKKGENFDAKKLESQAAWASRVKNSPSPVDLSGGGQSGLQTLGFEGEYDACRQHGAHGHPVSV